MKKQIAQILFIGVSTVIGFSIAGSLMFPFLNVKEPFLVFLKQYLFTLGIAIGVLAVMTTVCWSFMYLAKRLYNKLFS